MFSVILRGWCFWHNFNFPFVPKFENIPHNYFCVLSQPWGKLKEKMWLWKLTVSTLSHEFLLYCKIHPDFPCLCQGLSQNLAHIESVSQFSHSVMSDSLWPHGLHHAKNPCPSPDLLKLISIESVMPSNHLILCHPLLLLPSILPSNRVFSDESVLHIRWPKYRSFSFSFSPSNEYSGLISFRIDWLDLHAVQGTLKSLLQHHSSKASIFLQTLTSIHDYWKNHSLD